MIDHIQDHLDVRLKEIDCSRTWNAVLGKRNVSITDGTRTTGLVLFESTYTFYTKEEVYT